jgi:hypothetical protein
MPTNDNLDYVYIMNKNAQLLKMKDRSNVLPITDSFCQRFRQNLEVESVAICGDPGCEKRASRRTLHLRNEPDLFAM